MLHRQVCQWKAEMTPEEWNRVTVLIIGRQLPRKDNLAVQYFARLFGQNGEGKRLIYAEGLAEEPRASISWPLTGSIPRSASISSTTLFECSETCWPMEHEITCRYCSTTLESPAEIRSTWK